MEYSALANRIKNFLSQRFPSDRIEISFEPSSWFENTYHVIHFRGSWEDRYTVKPETGLHFDKSTDPDIKGVEITSPILRTRQQSLLFFEILDDLRNLGLKSRSDLAGNHIHWGLSRDFTFAQLARIYRAVKKLLKIFEQDFAYDHGRDRWIDIPHFLAVVDQVEAFAKANPSAKVLETDFQPILKRTVLRLVVTYGTLEIRIFNSNIHPEVNLFEFDFALALFTATQAEDHPLLAYLYTTSNPERDRVLELLGLDIQRAERAFSWSRRRNQELRSSLESKKILSATSRYVQPTEVEKKIDDFFKESPAPIYTPNDLFSFLKKIPSKDISLAFFNIVNSANFESLSIEQQLEFLKKCESSFKLEPFAQNEIWAFRTVAQGDMAPTLFDAIHALRDGDLTVAHPLIRWMLKLAKKQRESVMGSLESLARDEYVLMRFLISYEKFLSTKRSQLTPIHISFLSKLVESSKNPEVGLRSLKLLNEMKFELQNQRNIVHPFFVAIESMAKKSRLVSLETLYTLESLARNDFVGPSAYVANHSELLKSTSRHLRSGYFPKLLTAWISVLTSFKSNLEPKERDRFFKLVAQTIKVLPSDLTKTERGNIKLGLAALLQGETSDEASQLMKIKF